MTVDFIWKPFNFTKSVSISKNIFIRISSKILF